MDAMIVFLNNNIDNKIYVELSPSWKEKSVIYNKEHICKLLKALYSLKQALRL